MKVVAALRTQFGGHSARPSSAGRPSPPPSRRSGGAARMSEHDVPVDGSGPTRW